MARGENSDTDVKKLKETVDKLQSFCHELIKRLEKSETLIQKSCKNDDIYLVPQGEWFGKKYE